ncbi:MAG: prolyl oligopeptidase family serine peptidase [Planctomycetes bacterium]|nr:prolyl oligopeptidase family serine peptidase [Planctomycetota bacterium]
MRAMGLVVLLSLGCQGNSARRSPWDEAILQASGLRPPVPDGDRAILDGLEARARDLLTAMPHPEDRAGWEKTVPRIRRELRRSLGLDLLPPAMPKNLRSAGVVARDDYRIEKLVYETLPGTEVPAHLYLPAHAPGKVPGILFVPGHWYADSKSRPEFQAFAITMARRGFAVITYDPFGQGERGISVRDHRRTELLAVGVAQEAIVAFESLCALEVLLARPEVDASRVGMTGASGGGFNSWILPALETRIAVTVPVVGTSDFLEQARAVRNLDWFAAKEHCHFIPRLLRYANNQELLACVAPRPVMVISAQNDISFPIPGQRAVVKYGEALYAALGAPGKVGYFEDAEECHGYQKRKREAAYGWFLKWLKGEGDGSPAAEAPFEPPAWNASELRCFPKNLPAGPGLNAMARSILEKTPRGSEPPRRPLAALLGIPDPLPIAPAPDLMRAEERLTGRQKPESQACARVGWRMPDGVAIPAVLVGPPVHDLRGVLVLIGDQGKEDMLRHPAARVAAEAGWTVVAADLRGMGELTVTKPGWVYAMSLLLGESFVGRQALDLIAGLRALRAEPAYRGKPVGLLAVGPFASLAGLYASVLEPDLAWFAAEGGPPSFRAFVERPAESFALAEPGKERDVVLDREIPHALIPFRVALGPDIPELLKSLDKTKSLWNVAADGGSSTLEFVRARMEDKR